ncbi:hypothetical protein [Aromatoleum tolulyticum]|uniref:hypothetical protein n=1 Tax=Aromatoleum tolulyticum TaxID=34027 RepID=UPI001481DDF9|nr:hypothetical protein [Aromatoleum tolulyticum]
MLFIRFPLVLIHCFDYRGATAFAVLNGPSGMFLLDTRIDLRKSLLFKLESQAPAAHPD